MQCYQLPTIDGYFLPFLFGYSPGVDSNHTQLIVFIESHDWSSTLSLESWDVVLNIFFFFVNLDESILFFNTTLKYFIYSFGRINTSIKISRIAENHKFFDWLILFDRSQRDKRGVIYSFLQLQKSVLISVRVLAYVFRGKKDRLYFVPSTQCVQHSEVSGIEPKVGVFFPILPVIEIVGTSEY